MDIQTHDLRGALSARFHSFLKRHPRLRQGTLSTYTAFDRLWARARHPLLGSSPKPEPIASSAEWVGAFNGERVRPAIAWLGHAEVINNPLPKSRHGFVDHEYEMARTGEIPPAFVLTIPQGRVVGEHGAVVTPDHRLLLDVSKPVGSLRSYMLGDHGSIPGRDQFFVDAALPSRPVKGTVAVLTAFVGRGYFHWLWDVLPRLRLLEESGNAIDSIGAFVVPGYFSGFQIETLSALGVGRPRVISSLHDRNIEAELLLVPSLPRATGLVPTWAIEYLRRAFPPSKPSGSDFPKRIYIVRKATDHGILESEDRLTSRLKKRGFAPLAMEDFTLREKAWLLGQAEAVVGPSGAGLCNIVFCQPGTKVVEIRVQPYPVMEPWDIANRCGLDFFDVLPVGYGRADKAMVATGRVEDDEIMATLDLAGL
ncbi:MAG: glycosyltransferase family 61 protein [Acidimicrobiia bacterium]